MENIKNITWIIIIEDGQLLGIYKNDSCELNNHFVLDNSDKYLTEREYEAIVTYIVDNFMECEYFCFVDIFR